jgi:uncharacterized membrane protein
MSLQPIIYASPEIQIHTATAVISFLIGASQFFQAKGTRQHRIAGWIWVGLMTIVSVSSLFINTTCTFGPFSVIHLLTLVTIVALPLGVIAARRHHISAHKRIMIILFTGALAIAGAFTFLPGRIMHDLAFGTQSEHERCWPNDT